jgi:hypothetical protein
MGSIKQEQPPVDRAICDAMVVSVPENWNVIVLTLTGQRGRVVGALEHSLTSPEGHPPAWPDDSLYPATLALDQLLQRHGGVFVKAIYTVRLLTDSWEYQATFDYSS